MYCLSLSASIPCCECRRDRQIQEQGKNHILVVACKATLFVYHLSHWQSSWDQHLHLVVQAPSHLSDGASPGSPDVGYP